MWITFGGRGFGTAGGSGGRSAARTRGSEGGIGRRGTCRIVVFREVEGWEARRQWRASVTSIDDAERSSKERFCTSSRNGRDVGVFAFSTAIKPC
jgi:hypothetical protein